MHLRDQRDGRGHHQCRQRVRGGHVNRQLILANQFACGGNHGGGDCPNRDCLARRRAGFDGRRTRHRPGHQRGNGDNRHQSAGSVRHACGSTFANWSGIRWHAVDPLVSSTKATWARANTQECACRFGSATRTTGEPGRPRPRFGLPAHHLSTRSEKRSRQHRAQNGPARATPAHTIPRWPSSPLMPIRTHIICMVPTNHRRKNCTSKSKA